MKIVSVALITYFICDAIYVYSHPKRKYKELNATRDDDTSSLLEEHTDNENFSDSEEQIRNVECYENQEHQASTIMPVSEHSCLLSSDEENSIMEMNECQPENSLYITTTEGETMYEDMCSETQSQHTESTNSSEQTSYFIQPQQNAEHTIDNETLITDSVLDDNTENFYITHGPTLSSSSVSSLVFSPQCSHYSLQSTTIPASHNSLHTASHTSSHFVNTSLHLLPPYSMLHKVYWCVPASSTAASNVPTCNVPICNVPTCNVPNCNVPNCNVPTCNVPNCNVPNCNVPIGNVPICNVPTCNVPNCNVPNCNVHNCNVSHYSDPPSYSSLFGTSDVDDPLSYDSHFYNSPFQNVQYNIRHNINPISASMDLMEIQNRIIVNNVNDNFLLLNSSEIDEDYPLNSSYETEPFTDNNSETGSLNSSFIHKYFNVQKCYNVNMIILNLFFFVIFIVIYIIIKHII